MHMMSKATGVLQKIGVDPLDAEGSLSGAGRDRVKRASCPDVFTELRDRRDTFKSTTKASESLQTMKRIDCSMCVLWLRF